MSNAPARSVPTSTVGGTFPAGTAILAVGIGVFVARVMVHWSRVSQTTVRLASVAGICGTILAVVAVFRLLAETAERNDRTTWIAPGARIALASPIALFVLLSFRADVAPRVQWAALFASASTIALSTLVVCLRARGMVLARLVMLTLFIGQVVEIFQPVARVAFAPGSALPQFYERLGWLSEVVSFAGAGAGLVWSLRTTHRATGTVKLGAFLLLPLVVCAFAIVFALTLEVRVSALLARHAFDVRFDSILAMREPLTLTKIDIFAYLAIALMVFIAGMVSFAGVGAGSRSSGLRALGWLAVLAAGFSSIRRPFDPPRLLMVVLAFVLLERAIILDADQNAPRESRSEKGTD